MCTVRAPELAIDALVSAKKCAPELSADAIAGHTARAAIASRPATGESRSDFSIMNLPSVTCSDVASHGSARANSSREPGPFEREYYALCGFCSQCLALRA